MPWPLQERFAERLAALPEDRQAAIDKALHQVVEMMEAQEIDAWPIVGAGSWGDSAEEVTG
jgi:nicotinamidase-related amidase